MSEIPVLLLDIDGVLNAMSKQLQIRHWKAEYWHRGSVRARDGIDYPMTWAQPVVDWINALDRVRAVEIRWHTTWQYEALKVGGLMGLNEFAVQDCPEYVEYETNGSALAARLHSLCMPRWWKYPAVERVVTDEKRRVIWIDDDINDEISKGARRALGQVHPVKLVCPASGTGLRLLDMAEVETTLAGWNEAGEVDEVPGS